MYDIATGLPQIRFEAMVAGGGRGIMAEKIISAGIPYFEIKGFQRDVNIFKDILAFFEILSLLFKTKPDVVHVSSAKAGGVAGASILIYKLLTFNFQLSTVFTAHGWAFNEPRPKWQTALIKFFSKLTCLFYDKIICVSEYDYKTALKNKIAPLKKLVIIHNGIKPEDYNFLPKEKARRALEIPLGSFLVGSIGEFTKNKGQKFLIKAAKNQFLISNYQFLIIGFGENKEKLKSLIQNYNLRDKVFLIDNLPEATKYLKAFDIFVLPSLKEGLPYVLLEAGLAGLPIIATNVGGVSEIVESGKNGLLVSPANPNELAGAINKLIKNPELRGELARGARQKIIRDFSFEKMLGQTINLYNF